MDTQTQIERLIELAIIQRSELKRLVDELPQLREHLSSEIEKTFEDAEPQLRAELEEFIEKRATDATAKTGAALEAKIKELSSNLEISTQARFNAIIAEREQNARLAAEAEAKIAEHAASLPSAVKDIVTAELARFPRAGEIDQLRKEFAEPRGLNPRGKWQAGESYNKLDLVTINGDSYTSNTDGNRTRPSRSSADWTLVAARGTGGGGGPTSLSELTTVPSDGDLLIGSGTSWVTSNLTAGAGISITVGPGAITISATDGDITLDDGTAASPSLHFTNDPDTGIYRPAANTLGISVSGTQVAYFDENGLTVPSAGVVAGGSFHGANGNANNPSFSFTSDQDTGFYRHGTNELGISIGGTEKAVMTSTTFTITPNLVSSGTTTMTGAASGSTLSLSGNATVADTILGASGPSVKSTLSARAPRQGLVFDGTAVTTSWAGNVLGTGDFTASAWIYIREQPAASQIKDIFSSTGGSAFALRVNTYGGFFFDVASTYSGGTNLIDATPYIGKWAHVVYSRSYSGTTTFYVNGVSAATRSPNDTTNYSGTTNTIGTNAFPGTIVGTYLYNRALSASEVVALYEAGAPSGADYYNTGAGAASVANVSSGDVSTVFTGVSANGFTATRTGGAGRAYVNLAGKFGYLRRGTKISIKATLTVTGTWYISQDAFATTTQLTTGSFNLTMTGVAANDYIFIFTDDANATLVWASNNSQALGLLLAPDAAQAGGGLVWYDTSGNAANITLPASGVSWNVPSSRVLGGNWTTSGNLTVSGGQALTVGSSANYSLWKDGTPTKAGRVILNNTVTNGLSLGLYDGSSWVDTLHISPANNVLIGTTTDTGYKLNVKGASDAQMMLDVASGSQYTTLAFANNGSGKGFVYWDNSNNGLFAGTYASGASVKFNTGLGVTALTLDSSQNATFAGKISATSSGTNIVQLNLPFTSRITLGEGATNNANPAITLYRTTGGNAQGTAIRLYQPDSAGNFLIQKGTTDAVYGTETYTTQLAISPTGNATFTGAIAIGNTVNTVSPTSPNRTITMVIGGTTYYIHAKTTND